MAWERTLHSRNLLKYCLGVAFMTGSIAFATPIHLLVDQREHPLGIDNTNPAFSWQSDAATRNWKQSAYRILVATSPEKLARGQADVWDSGRVTSSESVAIPYSGPELHSRERLYWSVRTWDTAGTETTSKESSWWEMGLLHPSDWSAAWIRKDDADEAAVLGKVQWLWIAGEDAHHAPQGSHVEFRYNLHVAKTPSRATLHIMVGGTYTAQVNGVQTGTKEEWGSFDREDIRDLLHPGDNTIAVQLDVPPSGQPNRTYPAALAAAIHLSDADGTSRWLTSDNTWQARHSGSQEAWQPAQEVGAFRSERFGVDTDRHSPARTPPRIVSGSSLYRKEFFPTAHIVSARLYITALGSYQAYLNGKPVTGDRLMPGFTDFRKRVLYQTYDVTPLMLPGKNTIAAMLGPGWHGSPLLWSGTRLFPEPDMLHAQLELTYNNGKRQIVGTDHTWLTSASPVTASEIYGGESFDARLLQAGWNTNLLRASRPWEPAVEDAPPASLSVTAQPDRSIHQEQILHPQTVTMVGEPGKQVAVLDMGQNMVGVVRLHVKGASGTTIRLRFAERLNPDGSIYTKNLRDADATDTYTLSGNGEETWEPSFTFHGFRYVELSRYPGKPALASIEGEVLNSLADAPSIQLDSSSDLLNKMKTLGLWGQRGNFVSVPTDCPQRDERMGWMGDAGVFWRTGSYNFSIDAFSDKFMQDVRDGQNADGSFANISPNLLMGVEGDPGAPGWGDAGVIVPYSTWLQFGDLPLVRRNWPAMERWMDFILQSNPNYIREKQLGPNYADWLAPDPHTPSDLVATAYWALVTQQMQTMANALHDDASAQKYAQLYEKIRTAYLEHYIHADGEVAGNTQSAYVLTLYTGLAPKELERSMTDRLIADIKAHGTHLTTGFLGTPFLLSVLDKQGRSDVAYDLLLNDTYPSWGYMVSKGATTWWERWNGDTGDPSMNSYNHYAFGSVMAWVYRRAAGIDADPLDPGFHHILIAPQIDGKLTHLRTEYDSVYGPIRTEWTRDANGDIHLTAHIPSNTTAAVQLPVSPGAQVFQDGKAIPYASPLEVGSGDWSFDVKSAH